MVCEDCKHPNPDTSHFCGECGHPLVRQPVAISAREPVASRSIAGPSLLGLDDDPEPLSYLLEDDPPPRSHGPIFLVLVLIVVTGGLGYLYWHNVYAPLAYVQPPPLPGILPPAFAYQFTPPIELANVHLAVSMANPELPNRAAQDQLALQRIAADEQAEKAAADPHNNPNLVTGEKYLYGRGVPQNCQQAVQHFQAAAKQDNAPALAHLGVMSASGQCMKLDRVAAYQWFARAKLADPDNAWLDRSMDMLWASMSHRERNAVLK